MNALHRFIIAGALTLPLVGVAQGTGSQSTAQVGIAPVSEPVVRKVDQAELTRAFTARDLIGKNVVNHDGERLGTINDVGLGEAWSQRFGATVADPAGGDAPAPPASRTEQQVYISTGGVLGLGGRLGVAADWVSVPADSLLYDRAQDRFILNLPQARFASIAQGRPRIEAGASRSGEVIRESEPPKIGAPAGSPGADGGTAIAGRHDAAASEVRRIEDALRNTPDLRGHARIRVSHTGSAIQLTGEVDDAALIRRAGDVARQHTDLEVRNLIEVSSAAAE